MKGDGDICFLLPYWADRPVGGYKIVYEYANRFAALGYHVELAYPYNPSTRNYLLEIIRHFIANPRHWKLFSAFCRKTSKGPSWFRLDPRVKVSAVFQYSPWFAIRRSRKTKFIATFVWTATCLNQFPISSLRKFYFIQDREIWMKGLRFSVDDTYRYEMGKIVISRWLQEFVEKTGARAELVPNALDFEYFKFSKSVDARNPHEIAMLWHTDVRKRTEDALAALTKVRETHPELHVTAFGACAEPKDLPSWVTFYHCPDRELHNRIYNNAAIFVASSEQEGWGLCPSEAMICGAAVACTDIGGYREFAKDGETALMSPVRDVPSLAANIKRLIEDRELRIRIANAGRANIQQFTWDNAVRRFLEVLKA